MASYVEMRTSIDAFHETLVTLGLSMPPASAIQRQFRIATEFLNDHAASPDEAGKKWLERDFLEWYLAMLAVDTACSVVARLKSHPATDLIDLLRKVLKNDIAQDYEPSQSKDFLYEMQVATWFLEAGFEVELAEPDLRISGNGLSSTLGVACKNSSSDEKLNGNISYGYKQIAKHGLRGFVALSMDLLVAKDLGLKKFVQFPPSVPAIQAGLNKELERWVQRIERRRAGVPNRAPLDGALLSLRFGGIWPSPPSFLWASQFYLHRLPQNPIGRDIKTIAAGFANLGR